MRTHTVQRGETLSSIASRYGTTVSSLARQNGVRDPHRLDAGERLRLPGKAGAPSRPSGDHASIPLRKRAATVALPGAGGRPSGNGRVGQWIQEAKQILVEHGVPAHKINERAIATMIRHESSGNPRAINRWDINARRGTPSMGIMQTIRPTFERFKLPGLNDIMNPVHNIVAAVRYAFNRYGSLENVPGIRNLHRGGGYKGY